MAPLWHHYGTNHTFWEKNTGIFELPTSFPITFTINFFSHNVYFGLHLQKTDATDIWIRCANTAPKSNVNKSRFPFPRYGKLPGQNV